jgi:hypothetical protein
MKRLAAGRQKLVDAQRRRLHCVGFAFRAVAFARSRLFAERIHA